VLYALVDRGPMTVKDLVATVPPGEMFKGAPKVPVNRASRLARYLNDLGLTSGSGVIAPTDAGRRYVAAGDPDDRFAVTDGQATILRDLFRQRGIDGLYEGVALALSLWNSSSDGQEIQFEDFGQALGLAGGVNEWLSPRTFEGQGRRFTSLLEVMGLLDERHHVTATGQEVLSELNVPRHAPVRELIEQARASEGSRGVWVVRAGRKGEAEALNFEEGMVSIGWKEVGDLAEATTIEDVRELYRESRPDDSDARVNTQASQLDQFVNQIQVGDLVLLPLRTNPGCVAVARVEGDYRHRDEPAFDVYATHTRSAQWLARDVPVEAFDEELRKSFVTPKTVQKIHAPHAYEGVMRAIGGATAATEDALHLVVKWSAKMRADTVERHIEVARDKGAVWWGLATEDADWQIDEKWLERLRAQIATGTTTHVFLSGRTYWVTNLLAVAYGRDEIEEELVPGYYAELDTGYHLWVKLGDFQETERDSLVRLLDPEREEKRGKPVALSNQTNPLLVRIRTEPRVWWVNQGATYARARQGGYIWAPISDKSGGQPEHWQAMKYLREGDLVLNYANTQLRAVSRVVAESKPTSRPDPDRDQAWGEEGLRAELEYRDLAVPLALGEIPVEWRTREGSPGPFTKDGAVKQGYLFPVSDRFAARLNSEFPVLQLDLPSVAPIRADVTLDEIEASLAEIGLSIDSRTLRRYHLSLNTSRSFVILAGVSGTGKTWLAEAYARAIGAEWLIVPVAPNWTTNEDLLGYRNPLNQQYYDTDFSRFLRSAAAEYEQAQIESREARRYHLVLDEMNLARVEYYFAKFLSAMELRARSERATIELATDDQVLLPPNLYFTGTVNVDETTHGFADKVYDRAQLIELPVSREALSSHLENEPYRELLLAIWDELHVVAPFAFRVLDEIGSYVEDAGAFGVSWEQALDEQLLQKVLPKIKGTDLRLRGALKRFIELCEDRFPISQAKAQEMLTSFNEHGFTSYF
jgi:hypothetical protein